MDKQEVVITRSKDNNGQLFQLLDKKTFKPTEWQPSANASIVQIAEAINGTFDVKGFLSHNCIIPLNGIILGHEHMKLEDVHEILEMPRLP